LVAADLAVRLDTSRTPVREALQLLASDGLVRTGKRGFVVREHTAEEVREIYEVRAALEGFAARLAAERADDDQVAAIEAIGAHRDSAVDDARRIIVDLNGAFHRAILGAAGNQRLSELNTSNSEHSFNYRIAEAYTDEQARSAVAGHARILAAIKSHDPDRADAEARSHVLEALATNLRLVR
jgi:DNA-binding GntR family transcriptional regulator